MPDEVYEAKGLLEKTIATLALGNKRMEALVEKKSKHARPETTGRYKEIERRLREILEEFTG